MKDLNLPAWATLKKEEGKNPTIELDPNGFVPEWLKKMRAPETVDQYWLECAFQCAKLQLNDAVKGTALDPENSKKSLVLLIKNRPHFAIKTFPPGAGVEAATRGKKGMPRARDFYEKLK